MDENGVSNITACKILHRSDKQPDRVEISAEQLCEATIYAEELKLRLKRDMRILGWYHSHPHITVWPSHVGKRDGGKNNHKLRVYKYIFFLNRYSHATVISTYGSHVCGVDIFGLHE